MSEKTEKLLKVFIRDHLVVLKDEIKTVEDLYLLFNMTYNDLINDLKDSAKIVYAEDLDSTWRIDNDGNVHEEDGTFIPFEKLLVMINNAAPSSYEELACNQLNDTL